MNWAQTQHAGRIEAESTDSGGSAATGVAIESSIYWARPRHRRGSRCPDSVIRPWGFPPPTHRRHAGLLLSIVEVTMTAISRRRREAAQAQSLICYYCGLPMWETDHVGFAQRHQLTVAQAALLRCTAEHVVARCDGGSDSRANIVAAHLYCNCKRHARRRGITSPNYQEYVQARMRAGRWLAGMLPRNFVKRHKSF